MCTLVILRRPDHPWPVVIGANRDEMIDRPALPPARHWPDRPEVVAGLDRLAGGSWLGVNDWGVAAAILNRRGSLGPAAGQALARRASARSPRSPRRGRRRRRVVASRSARLPHLQSDRRRQSRRVLAAPCRYRQDRGTALEGWVVDRRRRRDRRFAHAPARTCRARFRAAASARSRPRRVARVGGAAVGCRIAGGRTGRVGASVSSAARLRHGVERADRAARAQRRRAKAALSLRPMATGRIALGRRRLLRRDGTR